jgi:hypothetical protein
MSAEPTPESEPEEGPVGRKKWSTHHGSPERNRLVEAILSDIRATGLSQEHACNANGVDIATFRLWGKQDKGLIPRAREALAIWVREKAHNLQERTEDGTLAHPRELAWLLKSHAPEVYGDKLSVQSLNVNLDVMTAEQTRDVVANLGPTLVAQMMLAMGGKALPQTQTLRLPPDDNSAGKSASSSQ